MLSPFYNKPMSSRFLVEGSHLTRLQTVEGLFEYANYLEHLLKNAQDIQYHLKASEDRNREKFMKILKLEEQIEQLNKEYDVEQAEKNKKDLVKARMRIAKAKDMQYYYLMAGVTYGVRAKDLHTAIMGLNVDYPIIEKNIKKYHDDNIQFYGDNMGNIYPGARNRKKG